MKNNRRKNNSRESSPGKNVSFAGGSFKFTNNPTIIQSSFETDEEMGW